MKLAVRVEAASPNAAAPAPVPVAMAPPPRAAVGPSVAVPPSSTSAAASAGSVASLLAGLGMAAVAAGLRGEARQDHDNFFKISDKLLFIIKSTLTVFSIGFAPGLMPF
jgi:hypothetical protein